MRRVQHPRARSAAFVAVAVTAAAAIVVAERDTLAALLAVAGGVVLAGAFFYAHNRLLRDARAQHRELVAERAARRRSDLLARVGVLFEPPLNPDSLVPRIAELAVPDLADLAVVDLVNDDGTLRCGATTGTDVELARELRAMRARHPIDPEGEHPAARAVRAREALIVPELPEEMLQRMAADAEHLDYLHRARYRSAVVLPLLARDRVLGVLSLLRIGEGSVPYLEEDVSLGRELTRRASLVLDNALLFSELRITERRLDAMLANLAEAVTAFAPDGSLVFANQAAAELAGFETPELLLAEALESLLDRFVVLDEQGEPVPPEAHPYVPALRGEHPAPSLVRSIDRATGVDRWLVTRAAPVFDEADRVQLVVSVTEDVTAVKRDEARQRFLASASKLLTSSLDLAATVEKVAWAGVPELWDWARVDLLDDRDVLAEAAVAHRDLEKAELLREWRRLYPPAEEDSRGSREVVRSGKSVIWREVRPGDVERYARDARHAKMMRAVDTRSMLLVPIVAAGRVLGVVQLATTGESERRLSEEDLELAEELGRRAGVAIENARLHEGRSHIASTLQRSLLPPRLPVVPGLTIAARFRAAGETSEVGGDFYDLFPAQDGWMIVMGDVTGKGPAAAAITSLARYTMRTAAMYERDPRNVLARLNTVLAADPDERQFCTAVCVQVTPRDTGGVHVLIACAGHPAPYLVEANGKVCEVEATGSLLGAFEEGSWACAELDLEEGDELVLFTDGVTDTRGASGRFGHERLEDLLRAIGPAEADEMAGRIDDALLSFQEGPQRDDVALLVLRTSGGGPSEPAVATLVATGD